MGKVAYACFLIIMSFLAAVATISLLRKFEPVRKTSSAKGKIVKITESSIEIRPTSGSAAQIFSKLENVGTYQNILSEFHRDDAPIEVYFSEIYYPFSEKVVWMIDGVSLDFRPAK